jgi:peptide/nickel transport system permease protein
MVRFILRRILQMIPLVLGITFISFMVMQVAPGDFLTAMRADPSVQPETIERLRRIYGLDQPVIVQYFLWLRNAFMGDFGYSFAYKQPVFRLIGTYTYYTLLLSMASIVFSWAVALPMGIYAATHKNGMIDRLTGLLAYTGISLPGFFVAILALLVAQRTGWLPVGGAENVNHATLSPLGKALDTGRHLILPTIVLGMRGVASLMRQMRGNLLDVLGENYILAARARGLHERLVILKHAVRNAINPLITILGFELAGVLGGAVLVEIVMSWPGLGRLLLEAVQSKDLFVAMASFLMGGVLLIVGNLVADVLLAVTDPRIKFS